jgi:hypothetical protein
MHARDMISTHPQVRGIISDALIRCIEECSDCAQTCTTCADACLGEEMVADLVQCIRLNLDCADICTATGAVATRRSGTNDMVTRAMLHACAIACRLCAEECEHHAQTHQHCRICAETCRSCEEACRQAMHGIGH